MKPKLLIVTGNAMKFKELASGLGEFFDCEQAVVDEPEIQGTAEEILDYKLKRAYEKFQQPVLVDDVSVHLGALNGFPGPYMKDFFKYMSPYEMGIKFAGTEISGVCLLGICFNTDKIVVAEGKAQGIIVVPQEKYKDADHFDIFVQAQGTNKPMIEFTTEEKNKFSHRGVAMKNLLEILKQEKK